MKPKQLQELRDSIPYLKEDGNIQKLIEILYKEVGQGELSDRMGAAFNKRQKDTKADMAAGIVRNRKGVIPPENMDFDD